MRWFLLLALLASLGGTGWLVARKIAREGDPAGEGPRRGGDFGVAVEVAAVEKGTVEDRRLFTGTLEAGASFVVAPKVGGRLERLLVDLGDPVASGDEVARLDDDEFQLKVEQAQAELEVTKANLRGAQTALGIAQREYERERNLHEKNALSQSALDATEARWQAARAEAEVAGAQLAQREAALQAARVQLSYTVIRAEWPGPAREVRFIAARLAQEGSMLAPSAPIVSVVGLDPLRAVIQVIERDYPRLSVDQAASISTDAYPGRTFRGRVARIAPRLEETSRQARVELEVANPERLLKPGLFVRVEIEFERREEATVVPRMALVRREGADGVFLVDAGGERARFVPVRLGIVERDRAEVLEPALEGRVVTLGHHLLVDGSRVLLPGKGESGR